MEYDAFLQGQEKVYSKFRDTTKIRAEGTDPSKAVLEGSGGYLIVLRHPDHVVDSLAEFSGKVARIVPAITYNQQNAHTTISDYGITKDFAVDPAILSKLCEGIYKAKLKFQQPRISYVGWLYNQDSVIAEGNPDEPFVQLANDITESCKNQGIEVRYPWGSHITASRFATKRRPEELKEFFEMAKSFPALGDSKLFALDIGYFKMSPEGFDISVWERFDL